MISELLDRLVSAVVVVGDKIGGNGVIFDFKSNSILVFIIVSLLLILCRGLLSVIYVCILFLW